MATTITVKCTKTSKEKSWGPVEGGKDVNRHTIEFGVSYVSDPDDADYKNSRAFDGSTMTLVTMDKKIAEGFKVDQEYELSIKKA